jgi:hypothetical protein
MLTVFLWLDISEMQAGFNLACTYTSLKNQHPPASQMLGFAVNATVPSDANPLTSNIYLNFRFYWSEI